MSWDNLIEYSSFLGRCGNSKASLIFLMFVADCMQPIRLMLQCRVFPHLFVTWWPLRQPSSTIVNHRQPLANIGHLCITWWQPSCICVTCANYLHINYRQRTHLCITWWSCVNLRASTSHLVTWVNYLCVNYRQRVNVCVIWWPLRHL